ncbi:MAG: hypothetical protein ACOCXQ_03135 [Patescibacteria group bacterium]
MLEEMGTGYNQIDTSHERHQPSLIQQLLQDVQYMQSLPEQIRNHRGSDDYLSHIVECVETDSPPSDKLRGLSNKSITDSLFLFSSYRDSPTTTIEYRYDYDDPYDDVSYEEVALPPIFDVNAIIYLLANRDSIHKKLPILGELAETLGPAIDRIDSFFPGQGDPFQFDQVLFISTLDQSLKPDDPIAHELVTLFEENGVRIFSSAREVLQRPIRSTNDFLLLWPEDARAIVSSELTAREHILLLSSIPTAASCVTQTKAQKPIMDCGIDLQSDEYRYVITEKLRQFIIKNPDFFTSERISSITGNAAAMFPSRIIDSIAASLVTYDDVERCLTARGHRGIAVLPSFLGYRFCNLTEGKMLIEDNQGRSVHLTYQFSDGREITLIVKFDEVILAMLKADNPGSPFNSEGLYYPVGKSYQFLKEIDRNTPYPNPQRTITLQVSDDDPVQHVWALTRYLHTDNPKYRELRRRYPLT